MDIRVFLAHNVARWLVGVLVPGYNKAQPNTPAPFTSNIQGWEIADEEYVEAPNQIFLRDFGTFSVNKRNV